MSLFDGRIGEPKKPKRETKTKSTKGARYTESQNESLFDPRYGTGSRSANRTTAARRTRAARKSITQRYESGELKFPDASREFGLCYCDEYQAQMQTKLPQSLSIGHDYHQNEMNLFKEECHAWKDADER